ncbi:Protein of unknown function [Lactobacillus acidophilus DSM 9126]|nr:Protein of unknown function [Lactobacillus acidophilus CIRM-BIA 445]CDF73088.1 Protein of unknown function [Lactobacillus acidophilus DSM 9126]CDF75075.1 Protein of unknown function [Lactobacillus acidophilus DSM 20242]
MDYDGAKKVINRALDLGLNFLTLQMFMLKVQVKNFWGVP